MIRAMRRRLSDRDTIDLLALMFGITVCVVIVVMAVGAVALVLADRGSEVEGVAEAIGRVISSILFVLLGLIAGRAPRFREDRAAATDKDDDTK